MAEIKYNQDQINELKTIKYVKNVTNKNITFTTEFKYELIKLSKRWLFYKNIFKKLWFPEYIINSKIPERSYHRWNNKSKKWLLEDKKWRPKKENIDFGNMTLEQENEYLKAKIAYYEEMMKYIESSPSKKSKI